MEEGALEALRAEFAADAQFKEIWAETEDGQMLCALINGASGWLMYLREEGDSGLSSRNPDYEGVEDAVQEYYLDNGQRDEYPLAWALPVAEIQRAMEYFLAEEQPAPWISWHDDAAASPDD